ncbi:MAG: tRNA (adenosine(37)-N6)-threonylcarbamoyltransferase complex ATPase subunit type 1 TsaE [Armatimonadetes bacterium]|nr:tRNA (adenosine(37)-N6)-threonylcarbamoyltransferase complex ATPase subunit type 1 TsaE [Armatimonadota bacterium]
MEEPRTVRLQDEAATRALGAEMLSGLKAGDVVLLDGELGAGKTTLVRGLLEALGRTEPVRSPTFNLVQLFDTDPPVMHADLYRVKSHAGIGIEDYLDTHLCLIEWPDRAAGLVPAEQAWHVHLEFDEPGRIATVTPPPWIDRP